MSFGLKLAAYHTYKYRMGIYRYMKDRDVELTPEEELELEEHDRKVKESNKETEIILRRMWDEDHGEGSYDCLRNERMRMHGIEPDED